MRILVGYMCIQLGIPMTLGTSYDDMMAACELSHDARIGTYLSFIYRFS
jgi:hypothetical protein